MVGTVKYRESVLFVLFLRQQLALTTSYGSTEDFEPHACNTFGAQGFILEDPQISSGGPQHRPLLAFLRGTAGATLYL